MAQFLGYEFTVQKSFYPVDESIALQLWCEDGPLGRATINQTNFGLVPPIDCCGFKNCQENYGDRCSYF
ncbi:MAG: hypothetical protein QNJ54_31735 [Prochloraceae cyanobacterium]|nr:hypothetical protein [Prochloraceae cyanobacterium]